jgi:hypothetical protein
LVVISGTVAAASETLLDPVRHKLAEVSIATPEVAASALQRNAVVTGAVRLALDRAENQYLAQLATSPV